jgi:voltage-gated potassium channel
MKIKIPHENPIQKARLKPWQEKVHEVIFESETKAGRWFDLILLGVILASVIVVMLESVDSIFEEYGFYLRILEWSFTALFTLEYLLRLVSVGRPFFYVFSFYGLVDLISILPSYLGLWWGASTHSLAVIRALRFLRIFRILKMGKFIDSGNIILISLRNSRHKISVFMFAVLTVVMIVGSMMFLIEGGLPDSPFTSIPRSVYWAIVTITTVGYGDIAPVTAIGQTLAAILMVTGYAIIAVPTGIVTNELMQQRKQQHSSRCCKTCALEGHDEDARYCKRCGAKLDPTDPIQT